MGLLLYIYTHTSVSAVNVLGSKETVIERVKQVAIMYAGDVTGSRLTANLVRPPSTRLYGLPGPRSHYPLRLVDHLYTGHWRRESLDDVRFQISDRKKTREGE